MHLEYADNATLYVPVSQLRLISRYTTAWQAPTKPRCRPGLRPMEGRRKEAAEQVRDAAAELLNIYARRAARVGAAFPVLTR